MLSKRTTLFFTLIFVLLSANSITGCSSNAEDGFELSSELKGALPVLEIGDKWTLKDSSEGINHTMTLEVTNEDVIDGKDCYVIASKIDPPIMGAIGEATLSFDKETMETLTSRTSGKYQGDIFDQIRTYTYTHSESPYPLSLGKKWTVTETEATSSIFGEGFESEIETNTFSYEVETIEEITVPAGSFECFKVVKYNDEDSIIETSWKSPLLKQCNIKQIEHDTGDIMELTGYTVSHSGKIISGGTVEAIKEVHPEYPSQTIPGILDNLDIRQVETRFDHFMLALANRDSDIVWDISYEDLFQDKNEVDFFIENNYGGYFENYSNLEVRESSIGELDGFNQETNPELADKTVAVLRGYVNYSNKAQNYFDATFVQIEDDWKLMSFEIFDKEYGEDSSHQSTKDIKSLSFSNVKLCNEIIDAAHYTLNPEKTYLQGQKVYVLFEVNGITTNKLGRQHKIHLQVSEITMFDSEGQEIFSDTEPLDFRESQYQAIQKAPVWVYFGIPLAISAGDYMVEIKIIDMFSGQTARTTASFSINESPLTTNNVHLCSKISGPGDFDIQPGGIFAPGDKVYIYIETPGIDICKINEKPSIWLKVTELNVYNAQDDVVLGINDLLSEEIPWDESYIIAPYVELSFPLLEDVINGEYLIEVTIEDGCTGDTAIENLRFTVKRNGSTEKDALEM
ncbi:hypothetical protein ACFLU3_00350 [Chloroflexota bacterium]